MKIEVNPLVVYSTFIAIKLHFEKGSYDAFKFNFKGPQKRMSAFLKSNDRYSYEKIAKKYHKFNDLIDFLLANTLAGRSWIREMCDEELFLWQAKMQRITYQFNIDMNVFKEYAIDHELNFDDCLRFNNSLGCVPLLELFRKGKINVESVITIDVLVGFLSSINKKTISDPLGVLSDRVYLMQQYKPFIKDRINIAASKNTVINLFTDVNK
jgi:hypothetical protein